MGEFLVKIVFDDEPDRPYWLSGWDVSDDAAKATPCSMSKAGGCLSYHASKRLIRSAELVRFDGGGNGQA